MSSAHDDAAVQTILDALPPQRRGSGGERAGRPDGEPCADQTDRPPASGMARCTTPRASSTAAATATTSPSWAARWPSASAETLGERDIVHLRSSPLERAQETAAPLAAARGLTPVIDPRVIESGNVFEGKRFGHGDNALRKPRHLDPPAQPAQAVVGRALQGGRRAGWSPRSTTPATRRAVTRR